jgi:sec-independent protein translocase protein TatB
LFDIGWSEMAVILLVALVVIGPRDLPRVARNVGRWVAKGRAMAREFQRALEDMAREAELDKVKSEIEKAGRTDVGKMVENTIDPTGEIGKAFDPAAKPDPSTAKIQPDTAGSEPETVTVEPETTKSGPVAQARPDTAGSGPGTSKNGPDRDRAEGAAAPAGTSETKPGGRAAGRRAKSAGAAPEARPASRRTRSSVPKPKATASARPRAKTPEAKPAEAAPPPRGEAPAPEREAVPADSS